MFFRTSVLIAAMALSACSFSVGTPQQQQTLTDLGDPTERAAAILAAESMLKMVDQGRADETWSLVGDYIHQSSSETVWMTTVKTMRGGSGALRKRGSPQARYTTTLNGAPPGRYFAIFYQSEFENLRAEEKVILDFEDGKWIVVGYFMTSKFQAKL